MPSPDDSSGLRARRLGAWLHDLHVCIDRTRTTGLAAETAFWLFLSLVPLAAVAGLAAARLSVDHWAEVAPVLGSLPLATRELIASELVQVSRWNGGAVGPAGAFVFLWLASSGVHAIFDSLELETNAARSWLAKRALALLACVALSVVVAALAFLGPGLEGALAWFARFVPSLARFTGEQTSLSRLLRALVGIAIIFGYVVALYWAGVPPKARQQMPLIPGALVATLLHLGLSVGYTAYLSRIGGGAAYTTGLSLVGATLMALYLFALALLIGALVNRQLASPDAAPPRSRRANATQCDDAPRPIVNPRPT